MKTIQQAKEERLISKIKCPTEKREAWENLYAERKLAIENQPKEPVAKSVTLSGVLARVSKEFSLVLDVAIWVVPFAMFSQTSIQGYIHGTFTVEQVLGQLAIFAVLSLVISATTYALCRRPSKFTRSTGLGKTFSNSGRATGRNGNYMSKSSLRGGI